MRDTPDEGGGGNLPDFPMTLLAIGQSYWLYEGADLLNDMLFGRGTYPFKVRCLIFRDSFQVNRHFGQNIAIQTFWRINPDVIDRLRKDGLLTEIVPPDV